MIVEDITLFANRRASFFGRLMSAAMAALLVVSFFGLTANPASAYALESDASSAEEQPSDDVAVPQNVYVYLQLSGDAAKAAEQLGLTHNNDGSQKWFTIGVIQLDIPEAAASGESSILLNTEESSDELVSLKVDIDKALKALVRFPDNEKLAIYGVQWNELKVCDGATDYPAASGSKAWHLDGELSVQLVEFDINYVDAQGQPLTVTEDPDGPAAASSRTLFVAEGSEMAVHDDATPMVSRAPGAEVIVAEAVPLGAFDAPVDPAPWVAGMGAIGTALWGVIAVRRRLVMAQRLVSFEGQVLGNAVAEPDAVAVPNAGHQAL